MKKKQQQQNTLYVNKNGIYQSEHPRSLLSALQLLIKPNRSLSCTLISDSTLAGPIKVDECFLLLLFFLARILHYRRSVYVCKYLISRVMGKPDFCSWENTKVLNSFATANADQCLFV